MITTFLDCNGFLIDSREGMCEQKNLHLNVNLFIKRNINLSRIEIGIINALLVCLSKVLIVD
jgi:hypothetical protein